MPNAHDPSFLDIVSKLGPLLTFCSALIAAGIAWNFGRIQAAIAAQQAKTAAGKLHFDQFDKRLKIYDAVTEYMNESRKPGAWEVDATPHLQKFAAAKWLFGPNVSEWLYGELQDSVVALTTAQAKCVGVEPGERLVQLRTAHLDELSKFTRQYERRDEVFGRWLRLTDE